MPADPVSLLNAAHRWQRRVVTIDLPYATKMKRTSEERLARREEKLSTLETLLRRAELRGDQKLAALRRRTIADLKREIEISKDKIRRADDQIQSALQTLTIARDNIRLMGGVEMLDHLLATAPDEVSSLIRSAQRT